MGSLIFGSIAGPLIRHGAGALGAWIAANGVADAETAQAVGGSIMTLGAFGISLLEKKLRF